MRLCVCVCVHVSIGGGFDSLFFAGLANTQLLGLIDSLTLLQGSPRQAHPVQEKNIYSMIFYYQIISNPVICDPPLGPRNSLVYVRIEHHIPLRIPRLRNPHAERVQLHLRRRRLGVGVSVCGAGPIGGRLHTGRK